MYKGCTIRRRTIIETPKSSNKYNKTHQYHDKIFKEILNDKTELINFLRNYVYIDKEKQLMANELEKYNKEFLTEKLKTKEVDILYKINNKEIFILIENQRKVDYKMPERMTRYCLQLIEERTLKNKGRVPLILPIVLYTGKKKWKVPNTISEKQEKTLYNIKPLDYPIYNLVNVNNYDNKKLIQENTGISKAMLFEKINTKEELQNCLKELFCKKISKEEITCIRLILKYSEVIKENLTKDEITQYQKLMEGEIDMSNFDKLLLELMKDEYMKGEISGKRIGENNGIRKAIIGMLKIEMNDEDIKKATNIGSKELEKIKKEILV